MHVTVDFFRNQVFCFSNPVIYWKRICMEQICIHCYVSGKVQGVWFRASAKEQAERLNITGWAKNLSDGRVEVLACGSKENMKLFYAWLQKGPRLAKIDAVSYEEMEWQALTSFDTL